VVIFEAKALDRALYPIGSPSFWKKVMLLQRFAEQIRDARYVVKK
jgi:NADPH-dependent glutamate synthase beta subunit-like oxidoreductase